jgi:uncharacterized membrane protein (DUF485 family)
LYILIGVAAFIAGVIIAAVFIASAVRINNERQRAARRKGALPPAVRYKRRKIEFSKLILALVLLPYFYAAHIGAKVVLADFSQLAIYLGFIAAPTATAIGFYKWKAKAENTEKIRKYDHEDTDVNNFHGEG